MFYKWRAFVCTTLSIVFAQNSLAHAACKKVIDQPSISITRDALRDLGQIGLDRDRIINALRLTAIPETSGCWAGATGNFDGQIVSAGTLQWNYGQNSLQPIIEAFKNKFTNARLSETLDSLMPQYGRFIFSSGCLNKPITTECQDKLLPLTTGTFDSTLQGEFNNLFESDTMIQVQVDKFVQLLGRVKDDLARIFPKTAPSSRQIKWAIDTKVQQGGFPGTEDIKRIRMAAASLSYQQMSEYLLSLVDWYKGLCGSIDQGGIKHDCAYNIIAWPKKIKSGTVTDEQSDLLNISFLKSRVAAGMSGHWQALTFQRRAKIILGVGSVGGEHD